MCVCLNSETMYDSRTEEQGKFVQVQKQRILGYKASEIQNESPANQKTRNERKKS